MASTETLTDEQQTKLESLSQRMQKIPGNRIFYSEMFQNWQELPESLANSIRQKAKSK